MVKIGKGDYRPALEDAGACHDALQSNRLTKADLTVPILRKFRAI
jgi:hypothetical protein